MLYTMDVEQKKHDGIRHRTFIVEAETCDQAMTDFQALCNDEAKAGEPVGTLKSAGLLEFETFAIRGGRAIKLVEV